MRSVLLLGFGFFLLVVQATFATLVPAHGVAPNLLLPIAIYLGVSHDVWIVRGAALSFCLGVMLDAFSGNPWMSLQTFAVVATFLVSRFAGMRLFLRGPVFQVLLTFFITLLTGGTILALRTIFEKPAPFAAGTAWGTAAALVGPALTTALVAPVVFVVVRRLDAVGARRREERPA